MGKRRKNRSLFAVMGLLASGPKSGYDIKKEAETRLSHFWRESFGQIYPVLRRLHEQGLVEKTRDEQSSRSDRLVYELTEAGWEEFEVWMVEEVEPETARDELLLKLYFGEHMSIEQARTHLASYRARYVAYREVLQKRHDEVEVLAREEVRWMFRMLTLRRGLVFCDGILSWCDDALEVLEEWVDEES